MKSTNFEPPHYPASSLSCYFLPLTYKYEYSRQRPAFRRPCFAFFQWDRIQSFNPNKTSKIILLQCLIQFTKNIITMFITCIFIRYTFRHHWDQTIYVSQTSVETSTETYRTITVPVVSIRSHPTGNGDVSRGNATGTWNWHLTPM
jgi:hypothetical protein